MRNVPLSLLMLLRSLIVAAGLFQLAGASHGAEIARWQDRDITAETVTALSTQHAAILTAQAVVAKTLKTQPPSPPPALLPPPPDHPGPTARPAMPVGARDPPARPGRSFGPPRVRGPPLI